MLVYIRLIRESVVFAFHALAVNRLRTFLSLLGITIGIFTIILVFTVVDSLERNVRASVESLGENVVIIEKWPWTFGPEYPWWKYWQRPIATYKEMQQLQDRILSAEAMIFEAILQSKLVKHANNSVENVSIFAASHEFDKLKAFGLKEGRYFTEQESAQGRSIAIVGSEIAKNLFNDQDAIGKVILPLAGT